MGKLIYATIASLDGYIAEPGKSEWAAPPDEEVHAFFSELERPLGTRLYGRKLYEMMVFWETASETPDEPPVFYEYAKIWQASEKIVYSRTLKEVASARTRIEPEFDAEAVRALKESSDADLEVGGAELGGQAFAMGLVDECHLFLYPAVAGGGKRALPDGVQLGLELLDERRFESGFVHVRYGVGAPC